MLFRAGISPEKGAQQILLKNKSKTKNRSAQQTGSALMKRFGTQGKTTQFPMFIHWVYNAILPASSVLLPERFCALRVCPFGPRFPELLQKFDPLTVFISIGKHLRVLLLRRVLSNRFPANFLSFLIAKTSLAPDLGFVNPFLGQFALYFLWFFMVFHQNHKRYFYTFAYGQIDLRPIKLN